MAKLCEHCKRAGRLRIGCYTCDAESHLKYAEKLEAEAAVLLRRATVIRNKVALHDPKRDRGPLFPKD